MNVNKTCLGTCFVQKMYRIICETEGNWHSPLVKNLQPPGALRLDLILRLVMTSLNCSETDDNVLFYPGIPVHSQQFNAEHILHIGFHLAGEQQ